jgi:hypothetical protein
MEPSIAAVDLPSGWSLSSIMGQRHALLLLATLTACTGEIGSPGSSDPTSVDASSLLDPGLPPDAPTRDVWSGSIESSPSLHDAAAIEGLPCLTPAEIIIEDARSHLGQPYVWGAEGPCTKGYDCSGLVYAVFKETGYFSIIGSGAARTVGQIAAVFSKKGEEDTDTTKLPEEADLITFGSYAHIGIFVGQKNKAGTYNAKGWIVNALNETAGVVDSYLHTGLSAIACKPSAFKPAPCP